ncbi:keratin, type I cytoskeletal 10-like [Chrysoperla carnea]|uniref:keratin, type I cytoskeletal 10-like n=1 Tax=Chrysoperla carnea TaxID=189513 RepID=UPI001D08DB85|nr:keratin, type I cytoskeletal 10-like [Chrysoperla carnea]
MSLNKILSLCAIIVCLKFVLSSPIPVPENVITQLVEVEAVSPIQAVSIESNPNNIPIRIARHLNRWRARHGGCHLCGGGGYRGVGFSGAQSSASSGGGAYGGGGINGAQSFAGSSASAGSGGYGGSSQTQAQSQSQTASFNIGSLFSASISSSSSSASSRSGGGWF